MVIENVSCKCCGKNVSGAYEGNRLKPCNCSSFLCVETNQCIDHCPNRKTTFCSKDGVYPNTFLYTYHDHSQKLFKCQQCDYATYDGPRFEGHILCDHTN